MAIPWFDSNDDNMATLDQYVFRVYIYRKPVFTKNCLRFHESVVDADYTHTTKAKLHLSPIARTNYRQLAGCKRKRPRKRFMKKAHQKRLRKGFWIKAYLYQKRLRKRRLWIKAHQKKTKQQTVSQDRNPSNSVSFSVRDDGRTDERDECCRITRDGEVDIGDRDECCRITRDGEVGLGHRDECFQITRNGEVDIGDRDEFCQIARNGEIDIGDRDEYCQITTDGEIDIGDRDEYCQITRDGETDIGDRDECRQITRDGEIDVGDRDECHQITRNGEIDEHGRDEYCQITRDGEIDIGDRDEFCQIARNGEIDIGDRDEYCQITRDGEIDIGDRDECRQITRDGEIDVGDRDECHQITRNGEIDEHGRDEYYQITRDGKINEHVRDEYCQITRNDEIDVHGRDECCQVTRDGGMDTGDRDECCQVARNGEIDEHGRNECCHIIRDGEMNEHGRDECRAIADNSNYLSAIAGVTSKICEEKATSVIELMKCIKSEEDDLCHVPVKLGIADHGARVLKKAKSSKDDEVKDELEEYFSAGALQELLLPPEVVVAMLKSPHTSRTQQAAVRPAVQRGLEQEMRRLATFNQFLAPAGTFVVPIALSGFFLLAQSESSHQQQVECAFCGLRASITLFSGANAMRVHRQLSPTCSFVLGENVGNVSVAEVAKTSSAFFLQKYSLPVGLPGNAVAGPAASVPSLTGIPLSLPGAPEVLVADSDGTAAVVPAVQAAAPSSDSRGQTVADSRPTSVLGHDQGVTSLMAGSNTSVPYQTAIISQTMGGSQAAVTQTAVSQTAGSQTAASQTGGSQTASHAAGSSIPYQTATMSRPEATSSDATRQSATASSSLPRNDGQSAASSTGTSAEAGAGECSQDRQLVTYEQLGIYSQRPKRLDMAVTQIRINTFENWPHRGTHPPVKMAEAGFYYTGHDDLVRCFHCKGGLKTWNASDKPWIEHSRWFPQCPFIKVCKGPTFVRAVSNLNNTSSNCNPANAISTISEQDVLREMKRLEEQEWKEVSQKNFRTVDMSSDPGSESDTPSASGDTEDSIQDLVERLSEQNEELQSTTMCKMCQTNQVNVLFLPCGHLVSCSQCAPALRTCAMCRQSVKGLVRVHMDRKYDSDELRDSGWTSDDPSSTDNNK